MSTVPAPNDESVPFFTDPRSLTEQLNADKRDWIPTKNENDPRVISGLVIEAGTYTDMNDEEVPTRRLLTDDLQIEWGVIGFHGWLKNALRRKNPRVGDYALIAFKGTKPTTKKGESDAYMYDLLVQRNPDLPPPAAEAEPAADEPEGGDNDDIPF